MGSKRIFSRNADFQKFEVLKTNRNKRHKYNEFMVEGVNNLNLAVKNGWEIQSLLYSFEKKLSSWAMDLLQNTPTLLNYELTGELMQELSGKEDTSEVMAVLRMREETPARIPSSSNPVLALFDRPSNKGNLGTILRSCDAQGVEGLVITGHGVDLYDPEVITASMGSFFKVPVVRIADQAAILEWINRLKQEYPDLKLVGTSAHAQTGLAGIDLTTPLVFLIGNETDGLSRFLAELSDQMAAIPMAPQSGATSLNVACAATVLFYEAARQRLSFGENQPNSSSAS
jgi:23S rRNA (uridine2479-2'-O)-methyltransferase